MVLNLDRHPSRPRRQGRTTEKGPLSLLVDLESAGYVERIVGDDELVIQCGDKLVLTCLLEEAEPFHNKADAAGKGTRVFEECLNMCSSESRREKTIVY